MNDFVPCSEWLEKQNWVQPGDCVYVVSDVLGLAKAVKEQGERFVPEELVEKLKALVGTEGTLLFPTFNWGFCKGETFDYAKTPVKTGALSKAALKKEEFVRTKHPIYSFAVWGKAQDALTEMDPRDSFGEGTVFEYMYEQNAKVLVVGLPALQGTTYLHHVEQIVGVPYRYNKEFQATYVDKEGVASEKTYRMYVRDLEMDPRHINGFAPLAEKMQKEGSIKKGQYCGVEFYLLRVRDLHEAVKEDILHNDSRNMYVYNGQMGIVQ